MADERLLTVEQVAERLQVNSETVRRWLRSGEIEGINLGGNAGWRVTDKALGEFLAKKPAA